MLFTIIFLLLLVLMSFSYLPKLKRQIVIYRALSKMPGPPSKNFIIGNLHHLNVSREMLFQRAVDLNVAYYPIYQFHTIVGCSANILTPEDCELIMSNSSHVTKGRIYDLLHNWLKDGLLTSTGLKWQTRRKILTPAFHFNVLREFISVFNEESRVLVNELKAECEKSCVINITPHMTLFTLKSITETAMGTKFNTNNTDDVSYKQAIYDISEILLYRLLRPWLVSNMINLFSPRYLKERKITAILHNFTKKVIANREKNFIAVDLPKEEHDVYKGKKRLAMLDLLLSAKTKEGSIDNEGVQEEVDTFMFEGHDTTATAISFTLMLLACNKHAQDLIIQEMKEVLDGNLHKKASYNDFQNMKYLERCIKESLRLYPSVYFVNRVLGEDVTTHNGYFLPKGTDATFHIFAIHHNPRIYPDPETFDPDRFLPENIQKRHPFAYLPFSAGLRNCIGQKFALLELKAAISTILANFVLEPIDTPKTITLLADIVLRTTEGIRVKLVPRK